jgi:hypothetical protein
VIPNNNNNKNPFDKDLNDYKHIDFDKYTKLYEKIKTEVIKTIRKQKKDMKPGELVSFGAYLLSTFIVSTVESTTQFNPHVNREKAALQLYDIVSEAIKGTIILTFEADRLK